MRAGRLRHQITIEQPIRTRDEYGEDVASYQTFVTVWANKRQPGGREMFTENVTEAEIKTIFEIRFRDDIDESMRVNWKGNYFDIQAITDPTGREEALVLMCVQRR